MATFSASFSFVYFNGVGEGDCKHHVMAWGVYHKAKIHGFSKGVFLGFWIVVVTSESCCLLALLLQDCWLDSCDQTCSLLFCME